MKEEPVLAGVAVVIAGEADLVGVAVGTVATTFDVEFVEGEIGEIRIIVFFATVVGLSVTGRCIFGVIVGLYLPIFGFGIDIMWLVDGSFE
jgi:hypothetical protein